MPTQPMTLAALRQLRREWRSGRDLAPPEVGTVLQAAVYYASLVEAARAGGRARLAKHRKKAKAKAQVKPREGN